jgi:hypothetical protein
MLNTFMLSLSLTIKRAVGRQSVATLNVYIAQRTSCALWERNVKQAPEYRAVDPACSRVGRATQTAGTFLAAFWLFFWVALAASVPALVEKRIVYLIFVGLIPAFGFYICGHILRQMLGFSCKLCEIVSARCVHLLAPFANALVSRAGASVLDTLDKCPMVITRRLFTISQWMQSLVSLGQKAYCLVHRWYWHVRNAILEFSCLLIRNTARFIIRVQHKAGELFATFAHTRRYYKLCIYHLGNSRQWKRQ